MSSKEKLQETRRPYQPPRLLPLGSILEHTGACSEGCGYDNPPNVGWYKGCSAEIEIE